MQQEESRPYRNPWLAFVACALLSSLISTPLIAQDEAAATFGDVVDVALVEVEVWVSDSDGKPVTGLTSEDFEVFEDGDSMPISNFREVRREARGPEAVAPLEPVELDGREPVNVAPISTPGHMVLYFDQMHMGAPSRKRLVGELRQFLESGEVPAERVLILSQSESLRILAHFDSTRQELEEALDKIELEGSAGIQGNQQRTLELNQLQDLWEYISQSAGSFGDACPSFARQAQDRIKAYASRRRQQVLETLGHLDTAISFLAGVPGVKTLVYVSDSLENAPGSELLTYVQSLCPGEQRITSEATLGAQLSAELTELTQEANSQRVTFYTFQASGLQTDTLGSASQKTVDFRGGPVGRFETNLRMNDRGGQVVLARETGGRSIFNRNDFLSAFEEVAQDMTSYYSLAYQPTHDGDGGRHRIEVKTRDRQLQVRHRLDYRDKSADERMVDKLESATVLGISENPFGVRLAAGNLKKGFGTKMLLPLSILVPVDQLAYLPVSETTQAQVKVHVTARDLEKGTKFEQEKVMTAPQPQPETTLLNFVVGVEVPPGTYVIAVGLRDEATREASFVSTTLQIQPGG